MTVCVELDFDCGSQELSLKHFTGEVSLFMDKFSETLWLSHSSVGEEPLEELLRRHRDARSVLCGVSVRSEAKVERARERQKDDPALLSRYHVFALRRGCGRRFQFVLGKALAPWTWWLVRIVQTSMQLRL